MKKGFTLIEVMIVFAILAILAAIAAPAFIGSTRGANGHTTSSWPERRGGLWIYTDPDTGCQYVQSSGDRQLTPRLGPDGHQLCNSNSNF